MNVKEAMSREVRAVRMGERLDAVARVLWEHDCGIVPIVDSANVLVGVLTDRDLCMASYTQGKTLDIPVTTVMARAVRTCKADDSISQALQSLQQAQVHRLPVVDSRGLCIGILALNDLIQLSQNRPAALEPSVLVRAIATIKAPRRSEKANSAPAQKSVTVVAASSSPPPPAPANTAPMTAKAPAANPAPTPVVTPKPAVIAPPRNDTKAKSNGKPKGKKG
jgi:CBS domain-containing protein